MRSLKQICVLAAVWPLAGCDYMPDYVRALFGKPKVVEGKAYEKGEFIGTLDVRFLSSKSGDGQRIEMVQLLTPFAYKDSKGVVWEVPAGFLSDGASIPRDLWPLLGGPYSGPYRDAAVVHDFYCWSKSRKWEDVHEVFLEAAINRGTSVTLAQTMYAGILFGGPRWPAPSKTGELASKIVKAQVTPAPPSAPAPKTKTDKEIFEDLKSWIEKEKPTLDQIRKRVEEIRAQQTPKK